MANGKTAVLSGEIETGIGLNRLARRLGRASLHVEVRDSCHFEGGRYLGVYEGGHLTLERINASGYLASGDADSVEQMSLAAQRLSRALSDLGVRHRFEISEDQGEIVQYLHHLWPQAEGT